MIARCARARVDTSCSQCVEGDRTGSEGEKKILIGCARAQHSRVAVARSLAGVYRLRGMTEGVRAAHNVRRRFLNNTAERPGQ